MREPMSRAELFGFFSATWALMLLISADAWPMVLGGVFFMLMAILCWFLDWAWKHLEKSEADQ